MSGSPERPRSCELLMLNPGCSALGCRRLVPPFDGLMPDFPTFGPRFVDEFTCMRCSPPFWHGKCGWLRTCDFARYTGVYRGQQVRGAPFIAEFKIDRFSVTKQLLHP